ncbi:hypothetical protein [Cryobacterium sp. Y82]|uniref:hypothetical protein n=1 Tax=Cryobacterium sp. Y82 TaxID=2045017 RepID=UPI00130502E0|nr:hypothetical protein [Cryobacterium sp. Y82]
MTAPVSPATTVWTSPVGDWRVELYGELVGHLFGTDRRTFDFVTARNAIETFSLGLG